MKRKGYFTKFYVAVFFSYFVVRIMTIFENSFTKDKDDKNQSNPLSITTKVANEIFSYSFVILGAILVLIDLTMIYFFWTATSKFIELLLYG